MVDIYFIMCRPTAIVLGVERLRAPGSKTYAKQKLRTRSLTRVPEYAAEGSS